MKSQQTDITEFDERMVRKLIRQIIIYQDRAMIEFKSGLQITVNE
ncbi:integrase [Eubacterium sp. F2]